jgi:hypothetical protein
LCSVFALLVFCFSLVSDLVVFDGSGRVHVVGIFVEAADTIVFDFWRDLVWCWLL